MRTQSVRIQSVAPATYRAAPLAVFETWREAFARDHPTVVHKIPSAALLRRIVMLRQAGDSFAEIARCCGLSSGGAMSAYKRLPEGLQ